MQIPFVNFQPVRTSEHMFALGIFGLLQIYAFIDYLQAKRFLWFYFFGFLIVGLASGLVLSSLGYIAPWSGRFYSLWNSNYAEKYLPIISSVSEHQATLWSSFVFGSKFDVEMFVSRVFVI